VLAPFLLLLLQAPAPGTLEIHTTSGLMPGGGKPAAARVYITDASGKPLRIPGAVSYSRREEVNSYIDGSATLSLAPGRYHVRAEKGMEYRGAGQDVEIVSGATARVHLDIPHVFDMNARGWYSGDLHNHRSPDEVPLMARAEDLNVSPVITRHVGGPTRRTDTPFPSRHLVGVDAKHIVSLQNQEVERLFEGHGAVDLLNAPNPVEMPTLDLYPMDADYCRRARSSGAFLDAEKPIWKNTPVNVALGLVDAIGVVNNHFHPQDVLTDAERYGSLPRDKPEYTTPAGFAQWVMNLYYSFLNCGFHIPVSAGSASGVMTSWPGYERVYVHLDEPFGYDSWFRALKAGHSFATNGPILLTSLVGDRLKIEAMSQSPIDRIEIVSNGEVSQSIAVGKPEYRGVVRVKTDGSGWLAVRCFEPVGATVRYAHTSPYWLKRPAVQKSAARHWADSVRMLAASVKENQYPSVVDYARAQAVFREAAAVYDRLAR
jgi:TolB protein